ncbi:MAG: hypothetical protein FWC89_07910 [Defluviitaleaceae bacterium]|nr:hypothetical protein [Defluviitaleaceae bacterium]
MLTFFVIAPVLVAVFLYVTATNNTARILAIVAHIFQFVAAVYLVYVTRDAEIVTNIGNYAGGMGVTLRANSISADFVFITKFIFLAISIYLYRDKRNLPMFWFLLFVIEASIVGIFLSGDLFNIFVLVEVSTAVTLVLVMFNRVRRHEFNGMMFLMTNIVAAQFYLLGIGYVYMLVGTLDVHLAADAIAEVPTQSLVLPYALIMTSVAFKCTLIPFFSWSPKVRIYLGAPTVVQAILSGLQIKSAVYLFLRFQEIFEPVAATEVFLVLGIVAGLFGAFMAICQSDIKMILAYHTVSQVGLIIVGVSIGNLYSYIGGLYHIFSHAVFKTALFLCAGIIIHAYNTSDIYKIRGVMKRMPIVGVATALAVLGIMGAPLFIGSVSKYFIAYDVPFVINIFLILISLGTIISFLKFSLMFLGEPPVTSTAFVNEKSKTIPSLLLGVVCVVGGVFGVPLIYFLFRQDVTIHAGYFGKSLIFLASVVVGYFINKYVVIGNKTLKRIGAMNLGFKPICTAIGAFFAIMLIYVGFFR